MLKIKKIQIGNLSHTKPVRFFVQLFYKQVLLVKLIDTILIKIN